MPNPSGDRARPKLADLASDAGLANTPEPERQHTTVEHTDRAGHRWRCDVGFEVLDGQLQPVDFAITGAPDGTPRRITTALMRSLPVGTIEEQARRQLVHHAEVRLAFEHAAAGPVTGTAGLDEARRSWRRTRGPESPLLHLVAGLYTEAHRAGDRAPAKTIARSISELRGEPVTSMSVRNWIKRCRHLGLLPPAETNKDRT